MITFHREHLKNIQILAHIDFFPEKHAALNVEIVQQRKYHFLRSSHKFIYYYHTTIIYHKLP